MEKKYEILKNEKIDGEDHNLYRIKALKDMSLSKVKKGDIGGFIESESNLSHEGECWIYDDSQVFGKSEIKDNVRIKDRSKIKDSIIIGSSLIIAAQLDKCKIEDSMIGRTCYAYGSKIKKSRLLFGIIIYTSKIKNSEIGKNVFLECSKIKNCTLTDAEISDSKISNIVAKCIEVLEGKIKNYKDYFYFCLNGPNITFYRTKNGDIKTLTKPYDINMDTSDKSIISMYGVELARKHFGLDNNTKDGE